MKTLMYRTTRAKIEQCLFSHCMQWCFVIGLVVTIHAEEVAKFSYKGFPGNLNGKTVAVPGRTVALSDFLYTGSFTSVDPTTGTKPSVFFIIDHSGSMNSTDRPGNRFKVTGAVVDMLYEMTPKAEVGLAVFRKYLYFYEPDRQFFRKCPSDSGAYVILLQLDSTYAGFGNQTGYQIIKKMLEIDSNGVQSVDLKYKPTAPHLLQSATNINAGFDAAKEAFKSSKFKKEQQFILFFSDGEANEPKHNFNDFTKGTDVPTTFTVYFTKSSTVPQTIRTMTDNIKVNNYSANNAKSNAWAFNNTSQDTLMKFIMANVISVIMKKTIATPTIMQVNGIPQKETWNGKGFMFADLFPLTGKSTGFSMKLDYHIVKDSVTPQNVVIKVEKDTTFAIQFAAQIDPSLNVMPDTFLYERWDRTLKAFNGGSQISAVKEGMHDVELRFEERAVQTVYGYKEVAVELTTVALNDHEKVQLEKRNGYFSITLPLQQVVSGKGSPNNKRLELGSKDTIKAVFRNPKLPLDTLTIKVPCLLTEYPAVELIACGVSPGSLSDMPKIPKSLNLDSANISELSVVDQQRRGVVLQVRPKTTPKDPNFFLEGTVHIVDALGNIVVRGKKMGFDNVKKSLNYAWNAQNDLKRFVGPGCYIVFFSATSYSKINNNKTKTGDAVFKVFIGISE